jgi:hypothetical protein
MTAELPFFTVGHGPPLVVLLYTPRAGNPTGPARWSTTRLVRRSACWASPPAGRGPPGSWSAAWCHPLELARRTAEGIPDADIVVYAGAGHSGTFTTRRFARDALAFLRGF